MSTSANTLYGSPKREISVILPVLNEQKYLEDSVNSILSQNFSGAIEVILAVGPSQDETMKIAQSIQSRDSRVVVVENPTGKTAAGLNLAIAAARYSIIVRVDGSILSVFTRNFLRSKGISWLKILNLNLFLICLAIDT